MKNEDTIKLSDHATVTVDIKVPDVLQTMKEVVAIVEKRHKHTVSQDVWDIFNRSLCKLLGDLSMGRYAPK